MNRTASALQFISPVERDTWVSIGMAIKSEFGDAGRDMWMDWSRQADSFKELDARSVWRSFRGTGVTIASLFHEAKQNGWRDEGHQRPTQDQINAQRREAQERQSAEGQERIRIAREAAKKAEWILSQCVQEQHAYLQSKGFPELPGLVWRPEQESNLLCVPMYVAGKISSLQMISRSGEKKFLTGGITSKAEYCIDAAGIGGDDWWVEGYASGLSLRACLNALKMRYRIHVCFSAGNLKRMAHSGYVVADNDASLTGLNAARATGLPYWMPDQEGTDINDFHKLHGTFKTSQVLRKWLQNIADEKAYYA
jgi:putative DNA primase/helicase